MKSKPTQGTISSTEVRSLLTKAAKGLGARQEKALRMRHGAGLGLDQPLPRRGQDHPEARAELLALEADLVEGLKTRAPAKAAATPQPSKGKDKIVRALRRLK
jgi:hypothetical protein